MTVKDLPLLAAGCLLPHTMGADICNPGGCLVYTPFDSHFLFHMIQVIHVRDLKFYVKRY